MLFVMSRIRINAFFFMSPNMHDKTRDYCLFKEIKKAIKILSYYLTTFKNIKFFFENYESPY